MNILVVGSGGPEIQVNEPVMEHVPRGVNIVKFSIRAGRPEVRQHVFGQAGAPPCCSLKILTETPFATHRSKSSVFTSR